MAKSLVAYFSATGTTKKLAERIAAAAGADLFEIVPEKRYTPADLDWRNKNSRSSVEMNDRNSRPAVASKVEDMSAYDTLYVGFPVWWYTAPTIIRTFLEQYDLSGKRINIFATSGGSGIGDTAEDLMPSAPGAVWGKADRMSADADVSRWV